MDRKTYKYAHSLRRQLERFTEEAFSFGEAVNPAGDILMRSLLEWFKTEYAPNAKAACATVPCSEMGRALNWREAYLFHGRDRALLAHYRNRRWFRNQPYAGPVVVR